MTPYSPKRRFIRTRYWPVPAEGGRWRIVDRREGARVLSRGEGGAAALEFGSQGEAHAYLREAGLSCEMFIADEDVSGA